MPLRLFHRRRVREGILAARGAAEPIRVENGLGLVIVLAGKKCTYSPRPNQEGSWLRSSRIRSAELAHKLKAPARPYDRAADGTAPQSSIDILLRAPFFTASHL
jgi:hypothetical protein